MIIINSFAKTYQQKKVLDFPGYSFGPGKIHAIIGANGSGKTTFARIVTGTLRADNHTLPYSDRISSIGYLPQKPYAFCMSLYKNLILNSSGDKSKDIEKAEELMTGLNLESLRNKNANILSGGEKAKMALARLLMKEYPLMILDEPTASMDINSTLCAESLIRNYCDSLNASVILITHSIRQAHRIADEVLFFKEGQLLEYGPAGDMLSHPREAATREFLEFYGI